MKPYSLNVLVGPTAVGKTKISIELAKQLNCEIISGDSMQVYRKFDIGTAKITSLETEGIPHHLIDIIEPEENFSVADFQYLTEEKIKEISSKDKLPMIVGGTGLYINAAIYEYNFMEQNSTQEIRKKLWDFFENKGSEELFSKLRTIDPQSAQTIHPNDTKRVIRALEVYYDTGNTLSSYHDKSKKYISKYNLFMIGLKLDRKKLYERINLRVDKMLTEGWLEEVESILQSGVNVNAPAFQSLGYKQLLMYLKGELSYETAVELIKRDTRRFAKRQLTWFNKDPNINWIDIDNKSEQMVINEILTIYCRSIK